MSLKYYLKWEILDKLNLCLFNFVKNFYNFEFELFKIIFFFKQIKILAKLTNQISFLNKNNLDDYIFYDFKYSFKTSFVINI